MATMRGTIKIEITVNQVFDSSNYPGVPFTPKAIAGAEASYFSEMGGEYALIQMELADRIKFEANIDGDVAESVIEYGEEEEGGE